MILRFFSILMEISHSCSLKCNLIAFASRSPYFCSFISIYATLLNYWMRGTMIDAEDIKSSKTKLVPDRTVSWVISTVITETIYQLAILLVLPAFFLFDMNTGWHLFTWVLILSAHLSISSFCRLSIHLFIPSAEDTILLPRAPICLLY